MCSKNKTDYENYAGFDKYYLDGDKSFNYEEAAIPLRNEMISPICGYEM